MKGIFDWIKNNKVLTVLIITVLLWTFARNLFYFPLVFLDRVTGTGNFMSGSKSFQLADDFVNYGASPALESVTSQGFGEAGRMVPPNYYEATPQLDIDNRRVVTESSVSLQVQDVSGSIDGIKNETENRGGYMVTSNLYSPEEGANGFITVRVPDDELDGMLTFLREMAVKVVSENIQGRDVTDEYIDIEERLRILNTTKGEFEEIYDDTTTVDEKLKVMNQILNVQSQIENLQGRLQRLDATSNSTLITIHLSTDEYSLPYAPQDGWRPNVIFKQAVRSLVTSLRGLGTAGIWIAVYAVLIIPAIVLFIAIKNMLFKKRDSGSDQQE